MAHLWIKDKADENWETVPLDGTRFLLRACGPGELPVVGIDEAEKGKGNGFVGSLLAADGGIGASANLRWRLILYAGSRLRVNGFDAEAAGGLALLKDRDEIVFGGRRIFFSTEEKPVVAPFPGDPALAGANCPRCRRPIDAGSPAVKCRKGIYYHESDEWNCFSYTDSCSVHPECPTILGGDFLWSPAELESRRR